MTDCPAAHSMDTVWFAVDADGHVGVFDSGEAGGVPDSVVVGMGSEGGTVDTFAIDALRMHRILARPETRLDGMTPGKEARVGRRGIVMIDRARVSPSTYREHAGVGPFEREIENAWVLEESTPRLLATRTALTAADVAHLAEDETVLGVVDEDDFYEWLSNESDTGVFTWSNQDYAQAGHYVRGAAPSDPIRLEALPPALRGELARAVIPKARFADTEKLDLVEHFDPAHVVTWGGTMATPPEDAPRRRVDRGMIVVVLIALAFVLAILLGALTR